MTVFGARADSGSKVYVPLSTCDWTIGDVASKGDLKNTVLQGFTITDGEAFDIRRCFNEVTHIFSFGRDCKQTMITIDLMCFIGENCTDSGSGLSDVRKLFDNYETNRLYRKTKSSKISIGSDLVCDGWFIGMHAGEVNPSNWTCTVSFTLLSNMSV